MTQVDPYRSRDSFDGLTDPLYIRCSDSPQVSTLFLLFFARFLSCVPSYEPGAVTTIFNDDARVIDQPTDTIPRRVKEALHIRKREGATMNKDAGLTLSRQWEACVEKSVDG